MPLFCSTMDTQRLHWLALAAVKGVGSVRFRALATMFDRRAGACRRVLNLLRKKLDARMFETVINLDTKFREASARGKVIFEIDPATRGAVEYALLAKEILAHVEATA